MTALLLVAVVVLGAGVLLVAAVARHQYRHSITECSSTRGEVAQLREEVNRLRARLRAKSQQRPSDQRHDG